MRKTKEKPERRNQIGQRMGRKGHGTRSRLIAAAARLVADRPLRELRVSDIAREAGVGAPTFYVYFSDVDAVVLAALELHPQSSPEMLEILDRDWSAGGLESARIYVNAYMGLWETNFALLRARNLAADEGDARFLDQRMKDLWPILERLAAKVAAAQQSGLAPTTLSPSAVAGVISASLERLAAAPKWGAANPKLDAELREAAAYMLATALGLASPAGR